MSKSIAVVGLGQFSLAVMPHLIKDFSLSIDAALDISSTSCSRFRLAYPEIPVYQDIEMMLNSKPLDLILVNTTAPSHLSICSQLFRFGYKGDLLLEKPLSNDLSAAIDFQQTLHSDGRITIDYVRRASFIYQFLAKCVRSGSLGKLHRVRVLWSGSLSMNGSHFIDLGVLFANSAPLRVRGQLKSPVSTHRGVRMIEHSGVFEVEFENESSFILETRLNLSQDEHEIIMEFEADDLRVTNRECRLLAPKVLEIPSNVIQELSLPPSNKHKLWYSAMLHSFSESKNPCSVVDALQSLKIIEAGYRSHSQGGGWVDVLQSPDNRSQVLEIS